MAERFQAAGLCWSVFLCLILAVLKLTVKAHWSWGRVSLPIWAVLGHNILYITIGFVWLYFADDGAAQEATTIRKGPWWARLPNRGAGVFCRVCG